MLSLFEAVFAEATSNGLSVEKALPTDSSVWDGRSALIAGRTCRIVKTRYALSNPKESDAVSIPLYLPKSNAHFLIYVAYRETLTPEIYIIPRGVLSKHTGFSITTLEKYKSAWNILKGDFAQGELDKRFTVLNWQLQATISAAKKAGLSATLIRLKSRRAWPLFVQTRALIANRRCSIHSFSRISSDPNSSVYKYVALRKPSGDWAEFQLFVLAEADDIYVVPCGVLQQNTTASLDNPELVRFKNRWDLLVGASLRSSETVRWKSASTLKIKTNKRIVPGFDTIPVQPVKESKASQRGEVRLNEEEKAECRPHNLNGGRPPENATSEQLANWRQDRKLPEQRRPKMKLSDSRVSEFIWKSPLKSFSTMLNALRYMDGNWISEEAEYELFDSALGDNPTGEVLINTPDKSGISANALLSFARHAQAFNFIRRRVRLDRDRSKREPCRVVSYSLTRSGKYAVQMLDALAEIGALTQ